MKKCWHFASLNWDQIATDSVYNWLEYNESGEYIDRSIQNKTAQPKHLEIFWLKNFFYIRWIRYAYPLINRADSTGTHPVFSIDLVYLLKITQIIQNGSKHMYIERIINDSQLYVTVGKSWMLN